MKENKDLVLEICGFDEIGYPLATTQGELTTVQKLFLNHGYPVYRDYQEEMSKNEDYQEKGGNITPEWKEQYRERLNRNREKHLNENRKGPGQ